MVMPGDQVDALLDQFDEQPVDLRADILRRRRSGCLY